VHELFARLQKRKVDILAGTQMVVKGLDFDGVSLVGIISADSLLSFPDFRVNERAFQLMEQVSGRAGRADGEGQVLIQAYNTKHMVLQWVLNHDVRAFYKHEIAFREQFFYPPFSKIIRIIFRHHEEAKVAAAAQLMADNLQQVQGVHVQGPGAALVPRVRNQYIKEIQIKCPRNNELIVGLKQHLQEQRLYVLAQRGNSNVQIVFDVDPA
jgi:primosomal protein N' (replication factor Y)